MKLIISLVIFLLLFSVAASAFVMSNPHYKITGVISDGGNYMESLHEPADDPKYIGYITIGQPVINPERYLDGGEIVGGNLTSENYTLCLGVFCTRMFEIPHSIYLKGNIKYDVGDIDRSEATLKLKHAFQEDELKVSEKYLNKRDLYP